MYLVFSIFFMFALFSGLVAKDLLEATGDAEFGRSGCLGALSSLLSGIALIAGVIAAFLILTWWKAIGAFAAGTFLALVLIHVMPNNPFIIRRISDSACISICAYIYALYWGLLDPGPWSSYFAN
jgi:hypothetical protein